jgi:DNA-binding MarR family transcriptional regulator
VWYNDTHKENIKRRKEEYTTGNMNKRTDISDEVLITLRKIIRAIDIHSRQLVKKYGLTGPQLLVLKELSRLNDTHISVLAERISLSQPTVTDILDRMESKQYIQRQRSENDKRRVMVKITNKAKEILDKHPSLLQEQFVKEFNTLQDWEQTLILSSIQRIANMMKAKEIKAPPVLVSGPIAATADEVHKFLE